MTSPAPHSQRDLVRPLLDDRSPGDALAVYYALHHDPGRSAIVVHRDPKNPNQADGFLVRAQTGQDLFRPLVTFRAASPEVALELFRAGLQAGRPNYFAVPIAWAGHLNRHLRVSDAIAHRIYQLDPDHFQPIVNIFVTRAEAAEGLSRYEVRQADKVYASAGVNWRSPRFAELYVYVDPAARGRGWGRSVVASAARDTLEAGLTPLYVVAEDNLASIRIAEAVGFADTGLREYVCEAVLADNQSPIPNPTRALRSLQSPLSHG